MITTEDYLSRDASGLADMIRAGEITALEAVEKAIELADRTDAALNAIITPDFERARKAAANASKDTGFAGVPSFIKDNENVEGLPTLMGSLAMPKAPVAKSSPFVMQFLAAGFTNLGKTALPEFGLTATTESIANGPTHNPWNLDHSPGGSSGGTAALVAAGVVPAAHGNDGGGSIRIPSSCCGLIGIKSSKGRLFTAEGADKLPIDIISQGILGRSVRDTARFLAEGEKYHRDPALPALGFVSGPGKRRLRIGLFTHDDEGTASHPDVVAAVEAAGRRCADLGHEVEAIRNPYSPQIMADFMIYWCLMPFAFNWTGKLLFGREFDPSRFDPWAKGLIGIANRNILRIPFVVRRLKKFAAQFSSVFGNCDVLLSPVLSQPPPKLGTLSPDVQFDVQLERVTKYACYTIYQNIAGTPAISLPMGWSADGLPIGVQFAAPMGQDGMLLELAYELEQADAWTHSIAPLLEESNQLQSA